LKNLLRGTEEGAELRSAAACGEKSSGIRNNVKLFSMNQEKEDLDN
jgi:hypothetical protein